MEHLSYSCNEDIWCKKQCNDSHLHSFVSRKIFLQLKIRPYLCQDDQLLNDILAMLFFWMSLKLPVARGFLTALACIFYTEHYFWSSFFFSLSDYLLQLRTISWLHADLWMVLFSDIWITCWGNGWSSWALLPSDADTPGFQSSFSNNAATIAEKQWLPSFQTWL